MKGQFMKNIFSFILALLLIPNIANAKDMFIEGYDNIIDFYSKAYKIKLPIKTYKAFDVKTTDDFLTHYLISRDLVDEMMENTMGTPVIILVEGKVNENDADEIEVVSEYNYYLIDKKKPLAAIFLTIDKSGNISLPNKYQEIVFDYKNANKDNVLNFVLATNTNMHLIRFLVRAGADINYKNKNGVSNLMVASFYNSNPDIVNFLIKNGANVNTRDNKSKTPLMYAAVSNKELKVTQYLVNAKANVNDVDENGDSALVFAAINNSNLQIMRKLLNSEADVNIMDKKGYSLLMKVFQNYNNNTQEIVEELIEHGVELNPKTDKLSPLMLAATYSRNAKLLKTLVDAGADINYQNKKGATALMLAAAKNVQNAKELIKLGANTELKDKNRATYLSYAKKEDRIKLKEAENEAKKTTK